MDLPPTTTHKPPWGECLVVSLPSIRQNELPPPLDNGGLVSSQQQQRDYTSTIYTFCPRRGRATTTALQSEEVRRKLAIPFGGNFPNMFASIIYEAATTLVNINHKFNSRRTMEKCGFNLRYNFLLIRDDVPSPGVVRSLLPVFRRLL